MTKKNEHEEVTINPAPLPKSQPIMEKPPKGYRPLTDDEQTVADRLVSIERLLMEKLGRIKAEAELAKYRERDVLSQLIALRDQATKFNQTLKIEAPDDAKQVNGKTWVKVKKEPREEKKS